MRLLELEIHNVRGICDLTLRPNGNNFVIWGPNGAGKSAVVDAIDFLLTGRISRLTGKGTDGITLSEHGPHIDHQRKDATVRALIQLPGLKETMEIERCMESPSVLKFDESLVQYLDPVLTIAEQRQHVLTRRDILRFITSEAGTRAQQIQDLLDIAEIEDVRKILVSVGNEFERESEARQISLGITKGEVAATAQIQTFNLDAVLQFANQNRALLGGQSISVLSSENIKQGLQPPSTIVTAEGININLLEKDIQSIYGIVSEDSKRNIAEVDSELRSMVTSIRANPELVRALARVNLTKLGITLIDDSGNCPLCDTPWPPGKLRKYLEDRLSAAQYAAEQQAKIAELSAKLGSRVNTTIANVRKVISLVKILGLEAELSLLQSWHGELEALTEAVNAAIDKYPDPRFGVERVQQLLVSDSIIKAVTGAYEMARAKYPEKTAEQTAWDILTRLEVNLEGLKRAEQDFQTANSLSKKASMFHDSFIVSRDLVLGNLYNSIKDRFVEIYRELHEPDEVNFTAKIEPKEAGLNLEVDFHGRGTHPPHALHSEGHQDSMGLCLYLALCEHLTKGAIDLVILDDVVMSIDAGHRRAVCRLFKSHFPDRQFFITTHDRTWANQLKSTGVVDKKGIAEFYNWHIDTGPLVNYEPDLWERIEKDLVRNSIPDAAARLRRASEQFFSQVCDALQARVTHKLNMQWELGDYLSAAMERYRELLKLAKQAANSWGDESSSEILKELDSVRAQIYARSGAEQWAVNSNVHYNNWANFLDKDFRPVVDAFRDLHGLFLCSNCGQLLHLTSSGTKPTNVRCDCGKVNLNLVEKTKSN
ncbi:MAG: ATP-binding protein [Candidatus Thorarchaeota archaeon]